MELWKSFEDNYSISNLGNIRNDVTGRILRLRQNHKGYLKTNISVEGKLKTVFPHRLVALYFVDNPNGYELVNHKDCDKTNNNYLNLEWCTPKYNVQHAIKHGRSGIKSIHKCIQRNLDGVIIQKFNSVADANLFLGKSRGAPSIYQCCTGIRKTAYGYCWTYE